MKNKKLLVIVLVLLLVLGGAGILYSQLSKQGNNMSSGQQNGEEQVSAPNFTLTDSSGKTVTLEDFRGKPVVVNFWATWCGFCVKEMPHFEESFQQHGDEIQFLMVNVQESPDVAKPFIEKYGYSFPVYYDSNGSASGMFGVSGLPATFFIDAEGNAVAQARGAISLETLQRGIDMLLPQN